MSGKTDSRVTELTAALDNAEKKLAERDQLINAAFEQTEAARAQYEQANARAETLRRQLDAKEEQLNVLQKELSQRDERIVALERVSAENDNVLDALNDHAKRPSLESPNERIAAMGLTLESLDQHGTQYPITGVTTTLGRVATNDIPIDSHSVSRFHARIVVEAEGVFLIDLKSTNGCKVNGKRVTRQVIADADMISVGDAKFKFSAAATAGEGARIWDETHVLLEDSVILIPAPLSKSNPAQQK